MLSTPCHIISDIHLGVTSRPFERLFEEYLRSLTDSEKNPEGEGSPPKSLIINGDLFDFWFEWKTVIPKTGFRTMAELARLREAGVEILWIAGNHDCWGSDFITEELGITYSMDPWEGRIGKWNARVEHADGLRKREDKRYRMIKPIMRSPLAIKTFRLLHPNLSTAIATTSSGASRNHGPVDGGEGLRQIGHEQLTENPSLDLLVYGHSHVPALESTYETGGIFANAGSWLSDPTYLEITDDSVSLNRWNGTDSTPHSTTLNTLNRRP